VLAVVAKGQRDNRSFRDNPVPILAASQAQMLFYRG
jgi:hypothetical protein